MSTKYPANTVRTLRLDFTGLSPREDKPEQYMIDVPVAPIPVVVLSGDMERMADDEGLTEAEWSSLDNAVRETIAAEMTMRFLKHRIR